MFRERDPFSRALATLRGRLRAGAFVQGEALTITVLAREMDLSPTPVREALSRLAGEGLIEDRRGRGYFGWRLDALDLVELYDLNALHVGAALGALERQNAAPSAGEAMSDAAMAIDLQVIPGEAVAVIAERLFEKIVRRGGGRTLVACRASLSDRLGPAWRVEASVLPSVRMELSILCRLFDDGA